MIGERLKRAFKEGEAWVLSYREECFQQIGLKPSVKLPLYNGSLECEFRKYVLFDGKLSNFREEGGVVKTDMEKQFMAEKRRTWKRQDFEKKQEERIDNEEADILSFRFTSLEKQRRAEEKREFRGERRERREFKGDKREFRGDKREFKGDKREYKGDKREYRGERREKRDGWKSSREGKFKKDGERETRADRQKMRRKMFGQQHDDAE